MPEYRKEWMAKARIDYFAPFVNLWLSCNAWYMDHYPEVDRSDRAHINKVKTDFTARNHLYKRFESIIVSVSKEGEIFRSNLEQLHFALGQAELSGDRIGPLSFEQAVCDYNHVENKDNLICRPQIKKTGEVFEKTRIQ